MREENYLWDKTGENREIERLENALQAFRYTESEPPALPAKITAFEAKKPFRFFRLSFALAACALFAFVSLGVWLKFSNDKTEIAKDSVKETAPQTRETISNASELKKPESFTVKTVATKKQTAAQNIVQTRKIIQTNSRPNKAITQTIAVAKPKIKLTKEEKYAYQQLMLALSITSSELKFVKDKAASVEEKENDSLEK
jgi:hypothetical protein